MDDRDVLSFATKEPVTPAPSCDKIRADVNLGPKVTIDDVRATTISFFIPDLEASFSKVSVGSACHGLYRIGVTNESGPEHAYRVFEADVAADCAVPGSALTEAEPTCWDSWLVHIEDSKGHVVADTTATK